MARVWRLVVWCNLETQDARRCAHLRHDSGGAGLRWRCSRQRLEIGAALRQVAALLFQYRTEQLGPGPGDECFFLWPHHWTTLGRDRRIGVVRVGADRLRCKTL